MAGDPGERALSTLRRGRSGGPERWIVADPADTARSRSGHPQRKVLPPTMTTPHELDDPPAASSSDRWSQAWAGVVAVSTAAVIAVSVIDAPAAVRVPATVWFVAICPGMAVVRLLRLRRPVADTMLAIALSITLASLIPSVQLYWRAWSP